MMVDKHLENVGCSNIEFNKDFWEFEYKANRIKALAYTVGNIIRNSQNIPNSLKQYFDSLLIDKNI